MTAYNINATDGNAVKEHILSSLGFPADPVDEIMSNGNWIWFRGSKPWVYTQALVPETDETTLNDGDHILLFPQDDSGLCPRSWVNATWPYLEKFRSNFSFFAREAEFYYHVTLIGKVDNGRLGISAAIEEALRQNPKRKVTRINCTPARRNWLRRCRSASMRVRHSWKNNDQTGSTF